MNKFILVILPAIFVIAAGRAFAEDAMPPPPVDLPAAPEFSAATQAALDQSFAQVNSAAASAAVTITPPPPVPSQLPAHTLTKEELAKVESSFTPYLLMGKNMGSLVANTILAAAPEAERQPATISAPVEAVVEIKNPAPDLVAASDIFELATDPIDPESAVGQALASTATVESTEISIFAQVKKKYSEITPSLR